MMCRDVGYRSSFLRFTHAVVHITKKLHERICYYVAVQKWADTYERRALSESWSNTKFSHYFKTKHKVICKENLPVNQMSTRAFSQNPLNLPHNTRG